MLSYSEYDSFMIQAIKKHRLNELFANLESRCINWYDISPRRILAIVLMKRTLDNTFYVSIQIGNSTYRLEWPSDFETFEKIAIECARKRILGMRAFKKFMSIIVGEQNIGKKYNLK